MCVSENAVGSLHFNIDFISLIAFLFIRKYEKKETETSR